MWAFVTSFCTISYFNLSGINGLSWVGMAEMPIHLRLRCTSWFFLSEFKKKKKKKGPMVTLLGVRQVLEEIITLEEQQHPGQHICFCFHLELN